MRVVIGLFVWLIEPRWRVIKVVINKSTRAQVVAVGYFVCVNYKL